MKEQNQQRYTDKGDDDHGAIDSIKQHNEKISEKRDVKILKQRDEKIPEQRDEKIRKKKAHLDNDDDSSEMNELSS